MLVNLLGMKAAHKMSDEDMARIIGCTRNAYRNKIESGHFTLDECKALCQHFKRPFEWLFATEDISNG